MAVTHDFEYIKPATLEEAVDLLDKYKGKAKILSGGTDLAVLIKEDVLTPDLLIDIKGLKELRKIEFSGDELKLGAGTTFTDIERSEIIKEKFRVLWEAAGTVASVGIRNRATVVGNICSAIPSLDSAPALMLYDAVVLSKSVSEERNIPIKDFFVSVKKTALQKDEIVTGITLTLPKGNSGSCYLKLGRYKGEDLAQSGIGVLALENNEYRIAYCAVAPVPLRATKIETFLSGKELTNEVIEAAKKMIELEISPITDIRSSKEYRMQMSKVMLERALKIASKRQKGEMVHSEAIL
jgi:carbon-monoxide dehydrogenase medium subunit